MRRMGRRSWWSAAAGAALVLTAATAAPAVAGPAGAAKAGGTAPLLSGGLDAGQRQMVRQFGAAAIDNQTALSVFRSWILRQPGLARSGYVGTIDDLAHKATTVMWYGPRTPLLAAIIREGARRGIRVSVQARKYSLQQINAASAAIWKQAAEGKWAGFKVTGVAGVAAADNGITVYGTYTAVPAAE